MQPEQRSLLPLPRSFLPFLALALGLIVVSAEAYLDGYSDYLLSNLGEESGPILFRVLLVSAPFLVLAWRRDASWMSWGAALILTVLVWGYVVFQFRSGGFEGGTSVGNSMWLALFSLGSTAVITAVCAVLSRRPSKRN